MKFRYDEENEHLIVSEANRIEYHQLQLWLTRHVKGYRFMPAFKMGVWSGKESHFKDGKINLGLWRECYNACKEIEVPFKIENKEDFPINRNITIEDLKEFCEDFFKNHKVKTKEGKWVNFMPYDYQIETAYKILKNRYCMAEVATSGGKSLIISIVIFYILKNVDPDAKFLIIVPSITLVTQFTDGIFEYNYGINYLNKYSDKADFRSHSIDYILSEDKEYKPCHIKIEEIMSDKPRKYSGPSSPNIYIGCYQSLEKWPKEFFKQFHTVACDEAHKCKSKTLKTILKRTFKHAYNRFGVSGTFPADDTLEILTIQSVLGPKVTKVEASTLVKKGKITPMQIKAVILNHNLIDKNDQLNYIRKMGAGANAFRMEKEYVQNSEKRMDFIKKIVDKCDNNTLVLFHNIEYGTKIFNKLQEEIPDKEFYYIDGSVNNKNREIIKTEMEKNDGKIRVLVASYGTLAVGVSMNSLFYLVMTDSFKSEQIIIQAIGRLLRKKFDKKIATIFDIVDVLDPEKMNNILYKHYRERQKFYDDRKYPYKEIKVNL